MIIDTFGCQPSQAVNQCRKISHCQDRAGFMPRAIQNCSGSPATSQHSCNCTGELCVHPVHLFTRLRTCPLTESSGFPTPRLFEMVRVPSGVPSYWQCTRDYLFTRHGRGRLLIFGARGQVPRGEQWCDWCFTCYVVPYLIVFKRLYGAPKTVTRCRKGGKVCNTYLFESGNRMRLAPRGDRLDDAYEALIQFHLF
jgi:hypothetical protein